MLKKLLLTDKLLQAVLAGAQVLSAVFAGAQEVSVVFAGAQEVSAVFAGAQEVSVVFAGAQVVCVGHPLLIVGDLNADPGILLCLAKGISAGKFIVLVLAYSLGSGRELDATYRYMTVQGFCCCLPKCAGCLVCLSSH